MPEEAIIVKRIFQDFLDGYTPQQMANTFNEEKIPSRTNKIWRSSTIQGILQNEKYMGDTKFQKVYTIDFLTHKTVKNEGELESYYSEDTHKGIINKIDFALVQTEIKRRNELRGNSETGWTKYSGKFAFSNLLRCGCCGARYRRFGYKNATGWIRTWACQAKEKKEGKCNVNYTIPEQELENAFNAVLREIVEDNSVLDDLMINIAESLDTNKIDDRLKTLDDELNEHRKRLFELMQITVTSLHARKQIDGEMQDIMIKSQAIQDERDKIIGGIERCNLDARRLDEMKDFVSKTNPLDQFNQILFRKLIRYAVIHSRNEIEFIFNMGLSKRIAIGTDSIKGKTICGKP